LDSASTTAAGDAWNAEQVDTFGGSESGWGFKADGFSRLELGRSHQVTDIDQDQKIVGLKNCS